MQLDNSYRTIVNKDEQTVSVISGGGERVIVMEDVLYLLTTVKYEGVIEVGYETNEKVTRTIYPGSESAAEEGRTTYSPVIIKFELIEDLITFKLRHL